MPEENHSVKVVSWTVFIWAIGLILVIFGVGFNVITGLDKKVESSTTNINELKVDIGTIKNDVGWIKKTLEVNQAQINPKK